MKCLGIKKNGEQCTYKRKNGDYCLIHSKTPKAQENNGWTISITFGDRIETHAGMRTHGEPAKQTFSVKDLQQIHQKLGGDLIDLSALKLHPEHQDYTLPPASLLIIPQFLQDHLKIDREDFRQEQLGLTYDTKNLYKGHILTKKSSL